MNSSNVFNRFKGAIAAAIFTTGLTTAAVPNEAEGAIVTLEAVGTINDIDFGINPNSFFALGDVGKFSFSFEDDLLINPDQNTSSANIGQYDLTSWQLDYGSWSRSSTGGIIKISNDVSGIDFIQVFFDEAGGPAIGDFVSIAFDLVLRENTGSAISDDVLNAAKFDIGLYDILDQVITFKEPFNVRNQRVRAGVASITELDTNVAAVPLPGAVIGMLTGLAVLGGVAAVRHRRCGVSAIAA